MPDIPARIRDLPLFAACPVEICELLPDGRTNRNYRVGAGDRVYFVRLSAAGHAEHGIDRHREYAAIQSLLAIIQGPTWALLLLGMFWRRATGWGGLACFVLGIGVSTFLTVYQKTTGGPFNAEEPFFAIASISFLVSAVTLVLVSLLTRPRSPEELRGLVYRSPLHDDEAQDALGGRAGKED